MSSSPTPVRRLPRRRPAIAATVGAALLAGCGVLNPVPETALTTRLWPQRPATQQTAQASGTAGTGTDAGCTDAGIYVGGLDLAMCEVDLRRRAYLRHGADVINTEANYNALLWPLGAAAVHEKLRGAPNAKLLLPAVLASASYGFLKAGIPERQKLYLTASRQLACAVVAAGPDLYLEKEIEQQTGTPMVSPYSLRGALVQLGIAINAYEDARAELLAALRPNPGKPAVPAAAKSSNVYDKWRSKGGGGRAAVTGSDTRPQVAAQTLARLKHAREQLALGQALLRRLQSGAPALALQARAAQIDAQLQQQLADKALPLESPASAADSFKTLTRAMLTLQASIEQASNPTPPDPLDAALPVDIADGLDADSQQQLRQFQQVQAPSLRKRAQHVSDWLARHLAGRADTAAMLEQSGCTAGGADAAALQAATAGVAAAVQKAAASSAARPATSNSPASGTALDKP